MTTRWGWMRALNFFRNIWPLSQIQPQEAHSNTVMTTTLGKGGCFLGTQRVTTRQAEQGSREHRTNRRENETLHFYWKEARSRILDTQANMWQEHLDEVYGMVEVQRNRRKPKRRPNDQTTKKSALLLQIPDTSDRIPDTNTEHEYRTRPVLKTAQCDYGRKIKKRHQIMSKNREILTLTSRHQGKGLHQISVPNSKVGNTGHVRYWYWTRAVLASCSRKRSISTKTQSNQLRLLPNFVGRLLR